MLNSVGEFLSGGVNLLIFAVLFPAVCGVLLWLFRKQYGLQLAVALVSAALNVIFALGLYSYGEFFTEIPYTSYGFEFVLRSYGLSSVFMVLTSAVLLLIVLYTAVKLKNAAYKGLYLFYLYLSIAMVNGTLLSDDLGIMLFFAEGLLAVIFGILIIGNRENPKTAFKALGTGGLAILIFMFGIVITVHGAGTGLVSKMDRLPAEGENFWGLACMMIGAIGVAGCMPFHSWTVNAADDAPSVFMAAFPGSLLKITGVYFAARIVLDIYEFVPGSTMSTAAMVLGAVTIVFAGAMALVQTNMKRLLSYAAVCQLGYIVLGIGTGIPAGILGGIYHLINYVLFITGLFIIAGIVEEQTGTSDLRQLGGLRKNMPVTFACFVVLSLSASAVPGLNGFFSQNLIYAAVSEFNIIFYICGILGTFLTALTFLNMGRSLFCKEQKLPAGMAEIAGAKAGMLAPACVLSVLCVLSGLFNKVLSDGLLAATNLTYGESNVIMPAIILTAALILAVIDHMYGFRKSGNALNSADHIHYAPVLKVIYKWAENGWLDPYNWLMAVIGCFSDICVGIEHGVSWVYDKAVPGLVGGIGLAFHNHNNGTLQSYLSLALAGTALITVIFVIVLL